MSTDAKQVVFGFSVTLLQRTGENDWYLLKDVLAALNVTHTPSRVMRPYNEGVDYMHCYEVLKQGSKGNSAQKTWVPWATLVRVVMQYPTTPMCKSMLWALWVHVRVRVVCCLT